MTDITVDFEALQSAIDHMKTFGSQVTEILADIDQTMTGLHAQWQGDASDAQAASQQQWEQGAEQMNTALGQLKEVAAGAHKNFTSAVEKNRTMWAG